MSKTIKNMLVGFMLFCVVVLIAFVIGLIVVNRDAGANVGGAMPSPGNISPGNEVDPTDTPPTATNNGPIVVNTSDVTQENQHVESTGKRYELNYTLAENLVLYADEELFEHDAEMEMANKFTYIDGENASLLVHFESLPQGAEILAESFLDDYLDGNESHVGGIGTIRHSSLRGVFVSGVNNGETFEAWIHEISSDIGMVFVIRYQDNEQKNALYAVLDTLSTAENLG